MSSTSYKESIEKRKEKQVEAIWDEVGKHPNLSNILKLRDKIKDVEKKR